MDAANHEPSAPASTSNESSLPPLYQHSVRTEWGLAILAWERDGKRAYQFEDGKLRIFKKGYYELLEEVDRSVGDASAVVADLNRQLGRSENRIEREEAGVEGKALLSFEDQCEIFTRLYPGGFQGDTWLSDVRGKDAGRRLKRHRDAAIADAQAKLSVEELDRMIGAEDYAAVCSTLAKVFSGTDLVSSKRAKSLGTLPPDKQKMIALALRDLLYGEEEYVMRFRRWSRSLRTSLGKISWQLATVPSALITPDQHVCVRPSAFREQAAWMAPRLDIEARPNAEVYQRLLDMALAVAGKLGERGLAPRDLIDVYDFMWTTLRPASRKVLDREVEPAAAASAGDDDDDESTEPTAPVPSADDEPPTN